MEDKLTELLLERKYTKSELIDITGLSDRKIRLFIQKIKLKYPVVSTSNMKGYYIAKSAEDIGAVRDALRNNTAKVISLFESQKQLKKFLELNNESYTQLTLDLYDEQ